MNKQKANKENIHDLIDEWHNTKGETPLHTYLGLTLEEYAHWVETDELPI